MKKISMFAMENDTKKYAVCVDGNFGLFESPEEAETVWAMVGGHDDNGPDGDSLAETSFGSAQMLPPGYVPFLSPAQRQMVSCLTTRKLILRPTSSQLGTNSISLLLNKLAIAIKKP